jgi:hypothetical protein
MRNSIRKQRRNCAYSPELDRTKNLETVHFLFDNRGGNVILVMFLSAFTLPMPDPQGE